MSSIYIALKLVCKDAGAAKQLRDMLAAAGPEFLRSSSQIAAVFASAEGLAPIRFDGVSSRGDVVSFDYQDPAQQGSLTPDQLLAWQGSGVAFLQYDFCDTQTDYRVTEYYHGLMEISAKEFKARAVSSEVPDAKKLVTLTKQGADTKVAQAIQRGVDINEMVAGFPLYVHVIRAPYPLPLAMAALAKREIDWRLSTHDAHRYVAGFLEFPAAKIGGMLQAMLRAAGPDLPALMRQESIWHLLLVVPEVMAWVCQQDGLDVDAPLQHASLTDEPFGRLRSHSLITREPCNCGSIMHHINVADSVFYDELARSVNRVRGNFQSTEIDRSIALLKQRGAKAVPPLQQSLTQRLMGYLQDSEDSVSLPQLLDMGLSLTSVLPGGEHPLAMAAQYPPSWEAKLGKINELLNAGAATDAWSSHDGFRSTVLKYVFDAEFRLASLPADPSQTARKFSAGVHTDQVLKLLAHPLKHGLNVSQPFKLYLWQGRSHLTFRGSLLGAIALLLCGRHSELRPWCVPMVRLLLAHGGSGADQAETVDTSAQVFASYGSLQLTGRWQAVVGPFKKMAQASVLERLVQRQATEGEDAIDIQVIELLQDRLAP